MDENQLKKYFKLLNRFMVLMWRLGLGRWVNAWPQVGGQILVITHRGRKSGKIYRTPANFALVDGEIYCTAGFGQSSDWYRNLRANPLVEVWLPEEWWQVEAEDAGSRPDRTALMRAVLIGSGFAAQVAGIDPYTISDAELDERTRDYRLIHLRRVAPRTGAAGPDDLAWVWPLGVFILLPLALRRRGRRCCG